MACQENKHFSSNSFIYRNAIWHLYIFNYLSKVNGYDSNQCSTEIISGTGLVLLGTFSHIQKGWDWYRLLVKLIVLFWTFILHDCNNIVSKILFSKIFSTFFRLPNIIKINVKLVVKIFLYVWFYKYKDTKVAWTSI